jgi:uncharacterized protein YraI
MVRSKTTLGMLASGLLVAAAGSATPMIAAIALSGATTSSARAQTTEVEPYYVVVKESNVNLRSGAGVVWYPVGKVEQGQVLRVDGHEFGWLRVGYPAGMAAIVKINEAEYDSGSGVVTLIRESRLQANNPAGGVGDSWRQLLDAPLPADTVLQHVETITSSSGEITGYRVVAPGGAKGYLSETLVRMATEDEVQRFLAAPGVASRPTAPAQTTTAPVRTNERAVAAPTAENAAKDTAELAEAQASAPVASPDDNEDLPIRNDAADLEPAPIAQTPRNDEPTTQTVNRFPPPAADAPAQDSPATSPALTRDSTPMQAGGETAQTEQGRDVQTPPAPLAPPASFADLNRAFEEVMRQPTEGAEYTPLINEFQRLLDTLPDEPGADAMRNAASGRIAALRLRADLQEQMQKMNEALAAADAGSQRVQESAQTLEANPVYRFVGRLGSSTVYNGQRLPLLYRVQAVDSGRTIAYLTPAPDLDLVAKLGSVIGVVVKSSREDESLGLPLVDARRVDVIKAESPAR